MTSDITIEQLIAATKNLLPASPPPEEAQIKEVLTQLADAMRCDADLVEAARKELHASYLIRMELGETIQSDDTHEPWVGANKAAITPYYWQRYKDYLIRKDWSPAVVNTLDRSLEQTLDLLGNPFEQNPWARRGLIVGDVQSGKTATYAGLINKAADSGYKMIILLTGTLENVRRQTQERLDEAFVGFDSKDFLQRAEQSKKRHVGVGLIDSRQDGIVFTSYQRDFNTVGVASLNISLKSVKVPVLVVSKKNKIVLERLRDWLEQYNTDNTGKISQPLLLIDDEADNASINTKKNPAETTTINGKIRELLKLFNRSSYVGFTATPFANIFIEPESRTEMLENDLFPEHFIHLLEAPDNYIGMGKIFPVETDGDNNVDSETIVTFRDFGGWLPERKDIDQTIGPLPDTLRDALRWFLVSCAIRDLRRTRGDTHYGGPIHHSMLVNVHYKTMIHHQIVDSLREELSRLQLSVRHHGAKRADRAEASSEDIRQLKHSYERYGDTSGFSWEDVLASLHEAVAPITVEPINQSGNKQALDYSRIKEPPGVRVIAVGGVSLSRGITLEGLTVSYFSRTSKAYDTLLQMARWFGYRPGYEDLCKVWITPENLEWFRHVTLATAELKRDFKRMKSQRATPREFGLRVRAHPDTLIITARNKMQSGLDVVTAVQEIYLDGRGIETARVHHSQEFNEDNLKIFQQFVGKIRENGSTAARTFNDGAYIFEDVDADRVAEFVEKFLVHPLNHDFQGDSIAEALRDRGATDSGQWDKWTILIPCKGTSDSEISVADSITVTPKLRKTLIRDHKLHPKSILLSGNSARVGDQRDLIGALSISERNEIKLLKKSKYPTKAVPEDEIRFLMQRPVLIIYFVQGKRDSDGEIDTNLPLLPAIGLHFPGMKRKDRKTKYVRYRLNRIAQEEIDMSDDDVAMDEEIDD